MSKGEHQILQNLDMAHKINHLSFGNAIDQKKTEAILKEYGLEKMILFVVKEFFFLKNQIIINNFSVFHLILSHHILDLKQFNPILLHITD